MTGSDPRHPPGRSMDEHLVELFQARARRLARTVDRPAPGGLEILTAAVGQAWVAMRVAQLREVMPLDGWAVVPGWPKALLGVSAQRGRPLPVVDLHRLLGQAEPAAGDRPHLLLTRGAVPYGLRIDRPGALERSAAEAFEPPAPTAGTAPFIEGVRADGLILLDVDRLLEPGALAGRDGQAYRPGKAPAQKRTGS